MLLHCYVIEECVSDRVVKLTFKQGQNCYKVDVDSTCQTVPILTSLVYYHKKHYL